MEYHLNIIPVEECNYRCPFCFEDRFRGYKVNIEDVRTYLKHFDTYKKPEDTATVVLFGGEPTLDLELMQQIFTECDNYDWVETVAMASNLQCRAKDLIEHTKTRHKKSIQVGLSGVTGSRAEIDKILILRDEFQLKISTVATGSNAKDVWDVYHFLLQHDLLERWKLTPDVSLRDYRPVKDGIVKTYQYIIDDVFTKQNFPTIPGIDIFFTKGLRCYNGIVSFTLAADGRVCGCSHIPFIDTTKREYPNELIEFMKRDDVYIPVKEWKVTPVAHIHSKVCDGIAACPIVSSLQVGHQELSDEISGMIRDKVYEIERQSYSLQERRV